MAKSPIVIVNQDDEIIGHKERGTLLQEDIYRVAGLWITNPNGDILLAQRQFDKKNDPGKWDPAVAGTVDKDETYESNIIKEAAEEIGLVDIKPIAGLKRRMTGEHNYFVQWFTLTVNKPAEEFIVQKEEVAQVKWFGRSQLKEELQSHADDYLKSLSWVLEAFA